MRGVTCIYCGEPVEPEYGDDWGQNFHTACREQEILTN